MSARQTVFMFSGQGSQYYQMGRELFEKDVEFRSLLMQCDEVARPFIQNSIVDTIYSEIAKSTPFDSVVLTTSAILAIEVSLATYLIRRGIKPDLLIGYSLGEFSASVIANVMSFKDAVLVLTQFGQAINETTCAAGLLAVVDTPHLISRHPELFGSCWLTGINFNRNFVMGGRLADIDTLERQLVSAGVLCQRLPVKIGFHTPLMETVKEIFYDLMGGLDYSVPEVPIISTVSRREIGATSAQEWVNHFWKVTREYVNFKQTLEDLPLNSGAHLIDVGPSGTLATFVNYLQLPINDLEVSQTLNPFGQNVSSIEKTIELNKRFTRKI